VIGLELSADALVVGAPAVIGLELSAAIVLLDRRVELSEHERGAVDLRHIVDDAAVNGGFELGGVDLDHAGGCRNGDGFAHVAGAEDDLQAYVAALLEDDLVLDELGEACELNGDGIGAGVDEIEDETAGFIALACGSDAGLGIEQGDVGADDGALGGVGDRALDAATEFLGAERCGE